MSEQEVRDVGRLVNGYQVSQALHVAVVLGVSDLLAAGPRRVAEVAEETGCHSQSLYRLLRALASIGVYEELPDSRFRLTALGETLRSDAPIAAWAAYIGRPYYWQAWSALEHSVRTGENAFRSVHGQSAWEYRAQHPDENKIFDAAMTSLSHRVAESVLDAYDFGRFTVVVDVGGGRGGLLAAILTRHPALRGVLFDQPHVVAGAPPLLEQTGVQSRCRVVPGDFFDAVPTDGDAYVLKAVLHDWEDPQALAILQTCCRAMPATARLLVIERLLAGPNQGPETAFSDLNMLVGPGGQERTEAEYQALLTAAGFQPTSTVLAAGGVAVIEAVPA